MVWKFCGKAQFPRTFARFARVYAETVPFPQNFHTMKLGQITVFYAVPFYVHTIYQPFQIPIFYKVSNELPWLHCHVLFLCTHSARTWDVLILYVLWFPLFNHITCSLRIHSHQIIYFAYY